jgi:hypothetical protein
VLEAESDQWVAELRDEAADASQAWHDLLDLLGPARGRVADVEALLRFADWDRREQRLVSLDAAARRVANRLMGTRS